MLALTTTARSLALSTAVCAALLLAGGTAEAVPVIPERQATADTGEAGIRLVHARQRGEGYWQQHGKQQWRRDHRGRDLHRKFRSRHSGFRRGAPPRRACHPVRRVAFHHGYKVLVGSILCYDRHGRAYVLRGTRHILRYLHH